MKLISKKQMVIDSHPLLPRVMWEAARRTGTYSAFAIRLVNTVTRQP